MTYPEELHLSHSGLPLAPHRYKITEKDLSPFSKEALNVLRHTNVHESEKLVSTFLPREKYVVHACNLALYLKLGMVMTKVHRVLQFSQDNFLTEYVEFCTRKRQQSTSEFRKRLFKAFSNSNFGKVILIY